MGGGGVIVQSSRGQRVPQYFYLFIFFKTKSSSQLVAAGLPMLHAPPDTHTARTVHKHTLQQPNARCALKRGGLQPTALFSSSPQSRGGHRCGEYLRHLGPEVDLLQVDGARPQVVQQLAQQHPVAQRLRQVGHLRRGRGHPVVHGQHSAADQPQGALPPGLHGKGVSWATLLQRVHSAQSLSRTTLRPAGLVARVRALRHLRLEEARKKLPRHSGETPLCHCQHPLPPFLPSFVCDDVSSEVVGLRRI